MPTMLCNPTRCSAIILASVWCLLSTCVTHDVEAFHLSRGRARRPQMHMNAYLDSLSKIAPPTVRGPSLPHESAVSSPTPPAVEKRRFEMDPSKSRTQRIMERTSSGQALGAGGLSTYDAFLAAEKRWSALKLSKAFKYDTKLLRGTQNGIPPPRQFVTDDACQGSSASWSKLRRIADGKEQLDYDVVVCGGTLGIFIALSLQLKGYNVCVVEAGKLRGREQEWNISRKELDELVELGILKEEEVERVITTEFRGCRSGFKNEEAPTVGGYFDNGIGFECFTPNVLNLGVSPSMLLQIASERFKSLGGTVLENTRLGGVVISESFGAALDVSKSVHGGSSTDDDAEQITARLVLDCMGNASPISAQQRYGMKPDGVCAVVGCSAGGYDPKTNKVGDIIYTNTQIQDKTTTDEGQMQYFWEAFPVGIGRNGVEESDVKTTYMFTYMDAEENRPSLSTLMEDYWDLLPVYQPSIADPEQDLDVKRVLFAYFPTYRDSPLKPNWSRLLAVGDASGIQSPLSFGGFGALTRHLHRISGAIADALDDDCLHKDDLGRINAYTPNLSAAWMFQRAMSVRTKPGLKKKSGVDPKFVNRLLANNFEIMNDMGNSTMMPFLQDVVRLDGLLGSLAQSFVKDPTFMPEIVYHVGVPTLTNWLGHVSMMGVYTGLHNFVSPILKPFVRSNMKNPREKFYWKRMMEAWEFGSGSDYKY